MSEERRAGDLSGATGSSFKMGLRVAAAAAGAVLLLCGGVAGYVAWIGAPADEVALDSAKSPVNESAKDSERILAIFHKIVDIDVPADFVPLSGDSFGMGRTVTIGRKDADGALLKLSRMDLPTTQGDGTAPAPDQMLLQMTEKGSELTTSTFSEVSGDSASNRELTVLGKPETFQFLKGKRQAGGKTLRKAGGAFTIGNSRVALIYTIPEEEYDEEAVVRMIESIRVPKGEAADGPGPSSNSLPATKPPHADPANRESGRSSGSPPGDDAQPARDETPAEKGPLPN
jgi:hypothetical protein